METERALARRPSAGSGDDEISESMSSETTSSQDDQDSITDDPSISSPDSDEPLLGRWPRRLLHVDRERNALISYEWEPGNTYGGFKEPKYNIISYTWGRFALKNGVRPDVSGIGITGVTWAIPRINPEIHFSVSDFEAAIRTVCTEHEFVDRDDVQFVWLDVACIDQENDDLKMSEVGRQTVIFQHAESAFIWLASSSVEDLHLVINELWDASRGAPAPDMAANPAHVSLMERWLERWLERSMKNVDYILKSEPWFTSLWTLQEAYLRPFAVLLARDGRAVPRRRKGWEDGVETLRTLAMSISEVARNCRRSLALGCNEKHRARELLARIQKTGLAEVAQGNPFLLYKAASFRTVTDELDRVYGIMQVFGLKLGVSHPEKSKHESVWPCSSLRKRPTLSDLELELSQRILERYPVQSHLSVFTTTPLPGQAWRLSPSSEIPHFSRLASTYLFVNRGPQRSLRSDEHKQRALCRFSTTTDPSIGRQNLPRLQRYIFSMRDLFHSPVTWCHFSGKATPLATLHDIWNRLNRGEMGYDSTSHTIQEMALDLERDPKSYELTIPHIQGFPLVGYEVQNKRQDDVAVRLIERFQGEQLLVLCLGTQSQPTKTLGKTIYGLVMVHREWRGVEYWRRIGIVSWEVFDLPREMSATEKSTLQVRSEHWKEVEGLYG